KSKSTVWSIRSFSPEEVDKLAPTDSLHPWAKRYSFSAPKGSGLHWDYVHPTTGFLFNSAYPFGGNDGVIWAGKGLTSFAQAGIAMRWGVLSAKLAPVAFRSENLSFSLMDNGRIGPLRFADGQLALAVDKPQRFGDLPYSRLDLGESTIRIDAGPFATGLSTASQWWGPTSEYPYILGNNAGGFPHLFVGTAHPVGVKIGTVHARVVYGSLAQSPYSSVTGNDYFESYTNPGKVRFMAGLVGVVQINRINGLELGGGRFFHAASAQTRFTGSNVRLPFQNFLKSRIRAESDTVFGDDRSLQQNQLASAFFRWAPPGTGVELYGEYGREDFSADLRDLFLEPDHSATLNGGFRKAWSYGTSMNAVRAEIFTYEAPAGTRNRGEGLIYLHLPLAQGHTQRGQILGAPVGVGSGSAQMIAFERYTPGGKMKTFLSRVTQREHSLVEQAYLSGEPFTKGVDVMNSIGAEMSRFLGPFDISGKVVFTDNLNRYFNSDVSNLNVGLTVRQSF
ncbi:MAG: capsule assembly Wzi family protein, partial [Gemmatimonadaceae bacterium]